MTKYISPEGHWQPWYDDRRDYNTNAPTYYDYLANQNKLTKEIVNVVNDELGRDVDFLDSDEIHVDKLTDWHDDDPEHKNKTTFKAHVITSPKTLTYSIDNVDYQASNALKVLDSGLYTPDFSQVISQQTARLNEATSTGKRAESKADAAQKSADTAQQAANKAQESANNNARSINTLNTNKQDKLTAGYGISIEDNVIKSPFHTKVADTFDLDTLDFGCVRGYNMVHAPTTGWFYVQATSEGQYGMQLAWAIPTSINEDKKEYRRDKVNGSWTPWKLNSQVLQAGDGIKITGNTIAANVNVTQLPLPEQYEYHRFANVTTSGEWGFEFFNDTVNHVYYVKIKVGTITNANKGTIIAQQDKQTLLTAGVPADFLTKATNGYDFRVGYFIGDSLKRIAFRIITVGDKVNLIVRYYDGDSSGLENVKIIEGAETQPVPVSYTTLAAMIPETYDEEENNE